MASPGINELSSIAYFTTRRRRRGAAAQVRHAQAASAQARRGGEKFPPGCCLPVVERGLAANGVSTMPSSDVGTFTSETAHVG